MSSVVDNSQYSCEITMTYQSDVILSIDLHNAKRDEVTILQETNNDCTFVVFKGFLRPGGKILCFSYSIKLTNITF